MLDADESAGFDEAMRHDPELRKAYREMDCLATAVAVTSTVPVRPRPGQLERLHARLGLDVSKTTNWLGISGWAAAAALTMILVLDRNPSKPDRMVVSKPIESAAPQIVEIASSATGSAPAVSEQSPDTGPGNSQSNPQAVADLGTDGKPIVKVETKRLIQEIEVLRDKLENFQERDRKRFEPIAGMSWPIVMRMVPPGTTEDTANDLVAVNETPPMTAILGDALTASNILGGGSSIQSVKRSIESTGSKGSPSAIPIYDAARDTGTLVVSNLPLKTESEHFNLWVKTDDGQAPVYVGRLPESNNVGTEPFDFSLGSTGIVPSGFILTKDGQAVPTIPSGANVILQGPN